MHIPPANAHHDPAALFDFMDAHPFAAIVTESSSGLFATHLPLLLDRTSGGHETLRGHIALANPHHQIARAESEALVIFSGPNAYISPAWYPSKAKHGNVVPTWNYVAVHAYGRVRFRDDESFLRAHVEALTTRHEATLGTPWAVSDAPTDYISAQLRAIVGVELLITRLEGRWKMSQNRSSRDIDGVVNALRESPAPGDNEIAGIVERVRPEIRRTSSS